MFSISKTSVKLADFPWTSFRAEKFRLNGTLAKWDRFPFSGGLPVGKIAKKKTAWRSAFFVNWALKTQCHCQKYTPTDCYFLETWVVIIRSSTSSLNHENIRSCFKSSFNIWFVKIGLFLMSNRKGFIKYQNFENDSCRFVHYKNSSINQNNCCFFCGQPYHYAMTHHFFNLMVSWRNFNYFW